MVVSLGRMYKSFVAISNGKSIPIVALVDTGADETVISERLAKKLNLKLYGEYESVSASRHKIIGKLAKVKFKDEEIEDEIVVGVSDEPFADNGEEGIDVILGVNFLQRNNVKLNFKRI